MLQLPAQERRSLGRHERLVPCYMPPPGLLASCQQLQKLCRDYPRNISYHEEGYFHSQWRTRCSSHEAQSPLAG